MTNVVNALGSFGYNYVNQTERLASVAYPNGQTNLYSYYGNSSDQRLQQIHNKNSSGNTISKFDYEYDVTGQITKWTKQADSGNPVAQSFEYDPVDQLIAGTFKDTVTQAIVKRYVYGYDDAGNRTSEQVDNATAQAGYNSLNQMTSLQSGGPTRFKGSLNEAGTVSVAGTSATVATNNVFTGSADLNVGSNTVSVIAQDYSSNARTNMYSVVVTNLVNKSLLYDPCGNLTNDGTRSYTWDAANRITRIDQGTNSVLFSYDGLSRRTQIAEVNGGATNSVKKFLWVGTEITEQRDSGGGTVQKQFFPQGVRDSSTNYFYCRDHLGSIREVMASDGTTISARYDYDPYGRRTKISGSYDADFGYTGHFTVKPSWMDQEHVLTWFRVYRPDLARWQSRDPLGEQAGLNLYGYVMNNPVRWMDFLGLEPQIGPATSPPPGGSSGGSNWQFTLSLGAGIGGTITLGQVHGTSNFGIYLGFATGIYIELDPDPNSNTDDCPQKGFDPGIKAHGGMGVGEGVDLDSQVNLYSRNSWQISLNDPARGITVSVGSGGPKVKPNVGGGAGAAVGAGGTTTW